MAYTSDIIRGKQAADWGLVNFSVAGARLMPRALILASRIALGPVSAFKGQKTLMRASETMRYDEVCEAEAKLQAFLMGSAEYAEGLIAFNEKRRPNIRNL